MNWTSKEEIYFSVIAPATNKGVRKKISIDG